MNVISVNVSLAKEVPYRGRMVRTGIFKEPVAGRVRVRRLNIDGDDQADRRVHGVGFDMAIYVYPFEHYAYWATELGREGFPHGQFGENLTVQGLNENTVRVGDTFRIGGTMLQVTQPRIPCYKLTMRMDEGPKFPARFQESGRMGFYCRVLEEGEIGAGDSIELVEGDQGAVTIAEFIRVYLYESHEPASLKRVLSSRYLSEPWRTYLELMLKKAEPNKRPKGWEGFRPFIVDKKVPESRTITSFYLKPQDGESLPSFLPGQFLTFRLNVPDHPTPVMRTYSLSDSPNHPDYYRVTIKRLPAPMEPLGVPPGLSSNYFHDHVGPGTRLCIKAPQGKFFLDPQDTTPVVLLSGGVGLTPLISMLNAIVESGNKRPVWFVHGTRNGHDGAMKTHIRRLTAENAHVNVHVSYSQPRPEDREGRDYDSQGYVNVELLQRVLPPAAYDFYLCGPQPLMKSLFNGLLKWGVPESRINFEFFGPALSLKEGAEDTKNQVVTPEGGATHDVSFLKTGLKAKWDPLMENILDFAEAQGLRPPFGCRAGICQTCSSKLIEGEVEYVTQPLDMPDPGCVLLCVSRPKTNLILDV